MLADQRRARPSRRESASSAASLRSVRSGRAVRAVRTLPSTKPRSPRPGASGSPRGSDPPACATAITYAVRIVAAQTLVGEILEQPVAVDVGRRLPGDRASARRRAARPRATRAAPCTCTDSASSTRARGETRAERRSEPHRHAAGPRARRPGARRPRSGWSSCRASPGMCGPGTGHHALGQPQMIRRARRAPPPRSPSRARSPRRDRDLLQPTARASPGRQRAVARRERRGEAVDAARSDAPPSVGRGVAHGELGVERSPARTSGESPAAASGPGWTRIRVPPVPNRPSPPLATHDTEARERVVERHLDRRLAAPSSATALSREQRVEQLARGRRPPPPPGGSAFSPKCRLPTTSHLRGRRVHRVAAPADHRVEQIPARVGRQLEQPLVHGGERDLAARAAVLPSRVRTAIRDVRPLAHAVDRALGASPSP